MTVQTVLHGLTVLCLFLIFYTAAGYLACIFLLSRLSRKPHAKGVVYPRLTVLICACNEARSIGEKIRNTLSLEYPPDRLEIVVVSDGSTDGTQDIARLEGRGKVAVLHYDVRKGKPTAINLGVSVATGDIVLLSDARALYREDAAGVLASVFHDPSVGAACGEFRYHRDRKGLGDFINRYLRLEAILRKLESMSGSTMGVSGIMLAVRRELVPSLPEHIINDDAFIGLHVLGRGKRVVCESGAVCLDRPPADGGQEFIRRVRINAGRLQILARPALWLQCGTGNAWRYISHKLLRLALPLFLLGCLFFPLAALALPGEVSGWMKGLLVLQAVAYLFCLAGWCVERLGLAKRPLLRALCLPWRALRNLCALFPACLGLMRGTQGVLWARVDRTEEEKEHAPGL